MSYKLGVFIVHGMGSEDSDFADEMIEELSERINDDGLFPSEICFQTGYWADLLAKKEDRLSHAMQLQDDVLSFNNMIRNFIITAFGDVVAYQRVPGNQQDVFTSIHNRIHENLKTLRARLREGLPSNEKDKPIIVMAHSLGGYIMSNYIWNRQTGKDVAIYGGNDFLEMKTLSSMITYGCNIPIFTLAYDKIESITVPSPTIKDYFPPELSPEKLSEVTKWLNFYDKDDVLGYPLKPLSPSYSKNVTKDVEINAGNIFTSWNPLSHLGYDTDNDFTKPVTELIANTLKLL